MHRKPDLFHVGHPRSATGLVYSWLKGHPDVFAARKELHYFGRDIGFNEPPRTLESYLSAFAEAGDASVACDSSTWYLASETAAEEIAAFQPDARILLTLRDPTEMLLSLHAHLLANGDEDLPDLEQALLAEPMRRGGYGIPRGSLPRIGLYYRRHVQYAAQVRRYLDRFGRDRVFVLVFDDIKTRPAEAYRALLRWLGVRTDFPGFEKVVMGNARARNSSWTVRSRALQALLKRQTNQAVYMGLRPEPLPGWFLAVRALRRINATQAPRREPRRDVIERLRAELRPEVEAVEELLGRELPAWKGVR
jgi:hypothetical protein